MLAYTVQFNFHEQPYRASRKCTETYLNVSVPLELHQVTTRVTRVSDRYSAILSYNDHHVR